MAEDTKPSSKKMTDEELLQIIKAYEKASLGSSVAAGATISSTLLPAQQTMTTLELDRFNALNTYWARPLGNEVENRSQIVLPELRDTVEWIMPQLMRIFAAAKHICRFDPEGPQDQDQAELETQVVNHIFMKDNNGFFILHDYFKDALILRNGYAKVYWCEEKCTEIERYKGLIEDEVSRVMETQEGEEVEVLEQREYPMAEHPDVQAALGTAPPPLPQPGVTPQGPPGSPPPQMPSLMAAPQMPPQPPPPITLFDIKIRRTSKRGRVKVECIPPEEMRISPRTRGNLEDSPFAQHITETPRSDLIADGHSRDLVDSLTPGKPNWFEMDALARNTVIDQLTIENPSDHAMEEIEVRENILRVDRDGDGIAELRQVLVAGDKILEDEEIEETIFTSCVPKRMPHRHTGISLYDELADLQVIKTQLCREGLNNLSISNQTRMGVDWKNVNIDDLLTVRPGGVVRTNGPPSNALMPLVQPSNMIEQVIPAMEYVDSLREMRTGVGHSTMGLDADELQDVTKGGMLAAQSVATLKIELVARFLAEGTKDIFSKLHNCILRYQDKPFDVEISGKWMKVDPTDWRRRTKISPNVGLGSGNREEARANIALLGQMQGQLAQFNLIGPQQAYETFKRGCEVLGFENPQVFAIDPSSDEYKQMMAKQPPPPPAPQVQVAQIKAQSDKATADSDKQLALIKLKGDQLKEQSAQAHDVVLAHQDQMHQRMQSDRETAHSVLQSHQDRQVQMHDAESSLRETILKVLGGIIASQLKQDAQADAGATLEHDASEVK